MEMVFQEEEYEISMVKEISRDDSTKDVTLQSSCGEDSRVTAAVPGAEDVKKSSCRGAAALCLGVLCLLLLIGFKCLVSRFTKINSQREMEMVLLQTSYNNLTQERDQFQTSYRNLTQERDQFQTSYRNLTQERDQLQTSYRNLTQERDQLQTSYRNLTQERDQFQTSYRNLTQERDQLQTSYTNLTQERDQLQTSYNQLATEKEELQKRIEALAEDRNDLQRKLQDTEAIRKNLAEERADLMRILTDVGWVYFRGSFYHVSSATKNWQQSRDDCLRIGADLIIINSREEQNFVNQFKKYMWIGLTDSQTEGTWKWVDGTRMTTSYWGSGEPNGKRGENCGDVKFYSAENSWNDESCSTPLSWICEKKVVP